MQSAGYSADIVFFKIQAIILSLLVAVIDTYFYSVYAGSIEHHNRIVVGVTGASLQMETYEADLERLDRRRIVSFYF